MIRPNDLVLVDEISKVTGLIPRPHVATEAALSAALALPGAAAPAACRRATARPAAGDRARVAAVLASSSPPRRS